MKTHATILLLALALSITTNAADKLPAIAEAWQKSLTAESSNDYKGALEAVAEFKKAGGEAYLAAVRAGWLSFLDQDYGKANAFYAAAAKQEPRAITPHLGIMAVAQAQNKTDEVLRAARAVLAIDQYHRSTLLIAGEILYNQKDYRKAEVYFERAHKLMPEDPIAMSWYGWSELSQNQLKLAAPVFEKLMQINPEGYQVRNGYNITHDLPPIPPPGGPPGPP